MREPLAPRRLVCPNGCGETGLERRPTEVGVSAAVLHACPALHGLTIPLIAEGTRAELRLLERQDHLGAEVTAQADGRPVSGVEVIRDDGTDAVLYAPLVAGLGTP